MHAAPDLSGAAVASPHRRHSSLAAATAPSASFVPRWRVSCASAASLACCSCAEEADEVFQYPTHLDISHILRVSY